PLALLQAERVPRRLPARVLVTFGHHVRERPDRAAAGEPPTSFNAFPARAATDARARAPPASRHAVLALPGAGRSAEYGHDGGHEEGDDDAHGAPERRATSGKNYDGVP